VTDIPDLSPWAVGDLAAAARDLPAEAHPAYGTPLEEVIRERGHTPEWLEAAVLAGWLPFLEGIELTVRAHQEFVRTRMLEEDAGDALGDAFTVAAYADAYRSLAGLIEGFVVEIEHWTADLHRRKQRERGADVPPPWHRSGVAAAQKRARRAQARRQSAEEDNRAAKRERAL
jgi:hypothetical protein